MPDLSLAIMIILLLATAVFLVPFHISLNMEKDGPLAHGFYRIGWLGITLHCGRINSNTPQDSKAPEEPMANKSREDFERMTEKMPKDEDEDEYERRKQPSEQSSKQLSNQPSKQSSKQPSMPGPDPKELIEALPALARVFLGLVRSIEMEKISCHISFGLNDPAETAAMSGYLWSIASVVGLYRADIYIEPYFGGERLEGRFLAEIKTRLLWIALALAKAITEEKIRVLIMGIIRKEMSGRETA